VHAPGEEGAGDVGRIWVLHIVKELARQFFSALRKGSESSEEQRIGIMIRRAVSAYINDVESSAESSRQYLCL